MDINPQSRSPTSPVQPASKTMQLLRETPAPHGSSLSSSSTSHGQKHSRDQDRSGSKTVKNDGDYRWLEDDDEEDNDNGEHPMNEAPSTKRAHHAEKGTNKKSMSVEEAGKLFFSNVGF